VAELFTALNAMTWPGAFALVGVAAALAWWLRGHPGSDCECECECLDEDTLRRVVQEELRTRGVTIPLPGQEKNDA
jgi:hypothetical protein